MRHAPLTLSTCVPFPLLSLLGSIQATSAASFDQELPIVVRVKNIHYVMASLQQGTTGGQGTLRLGETKLPRGLTLQLKISLHDNLGNEILHNWDATEHLGHAVTRRDGVRVQVGAADFKLTVSVALKDG